MGENKLSFILVNIFYLVIFLSLIELTFSLHRFFFVGQFILLLILLLAAFISLLLIYSDIKAGWTISFVSLLIITIDMLSIYYNKGGSTLFYWALGAAAIALIISMIKFNQKDYDDEDFSDDTSEPEPETEYTPGKYIASKTATTYHAPKCDWAEKIKEKNRVWFDDDKEAKKAGYKKHSCVK